MLTATEMKATDNKGVPFLMTLYKEINGDVAHTFDQYEIGKKVGLTNEQTDYIVKYLIGKGWITIPYIGGHGIAFTDKGGIEVVDLYKKLG